MAMDEPTHRAKLLSKENQKVSRLRRDGPFGHANFTVDLVDPIFIGFQPISIRSCSTLVSAIFFHPMGYKKPSDKIRPKCATPRQ